MGVDDDRGLGSGKWEAGSVRRARTNGREEIGRAAWLWPWVPGMALDASVDTSCICMVAVARAAGLPRPAGGVGDSSMYTLHTMEI